MNTVIQQTSHVVNSSSSPLEVFLSNSNETTTTNRKTIRQMNSGSNLNSTGQEMSHLSDDLIRSSALDLNNSLIATLAASTSTNNLLSLTSNNNDNASILLENKNNSKNSKNINMNNQTSSSTSTSSSSSSTNAPCSSSGNLDKKKHHKCPFCERSFTRPYRLNDHISFSHTDEVLIRIG
jgi:hypothetical protein